MDGMGAALPLEQRALSSEETGVAEVQRQRMGGSKGVDGASAGTAEMDVR